MMSSLSPEDITGYLEQILGSNRGTRIPIYNCGFVIGLTKEAYICSQDPNLSRNHCSLKYLKSVNGTHINAIEIPTTELIPMEDGCLLYFRSYTDAFEGYKFESIKKPLNSKPVKRKSPTNSQKDNDKNQNLPGVSRNGNKFVSLEIGESGCPDENYNSDSSISSLDSLRTRIRKTESAQKKKEKRAKYCNGNDSLSYPSTSRDKNQLSYFEKIINLGASSDDENSESLLYKYNDRSGFVDFLNQDCQNRSLTSDYADGSDSSHVPVHSNLLKVLQKKVNDLQRTLKTLNSKFSNTMNENAKLTEIVKSKDRAEANAKDDFKRLLEEELICYICTELFIKPITLGCSHTFCQHCIFEWKKKKKQCPVCRERIEVETTVLFMDNFINKAVEQLDPASLEKRIELTEKREELQSSDLSGDHA